eukprot:362300_1
MSWNLAAAITNSIAIIGLLIINILLIRWKISKLSHKKVGPIINVSILTTLLFLISVTILTIASFMSAFIPYYSVSLYIGLTGTAIYFVSQSLMVLLFVLRIDVTFNATRMKFNTYIIKTLYILTIILIIIALFTIISFGFVHEDMSFYILAFWDLLHFILSSILIYLFVQRIDRILLTRIKLKISETQKTDIEMKHVTQQVIRQNEMSNVAIKHLLLVPIAIISTFICIICSSIVSVYIANNGNFMAGIIGSIDSFISSMCIYLLFGFNNHIYVKLCFPLHECCKNYKLKTLNKKGSTLAKIDDQTESAVKKTPESDVAI